MSLGASQTLADAYLALADDYTWLQLHVGDPGAAGTANPAGNTTRKQITWSAAAAGATGFRKIETTNALVWTAVSTSEDYTHYSVWSASSAGTFGHSGTVTANPVTAGDDFTIAVGDVDVTVPVTT